MNRTSLCLLLSFNSLFIPRTCCCLLLEQQPYTNPNNHSMIRFLPLLLYLVRMRKTSARMKSHLHAGGMACHTNYWCFNKPFVKQMSSSFFLSRLPTKWVVPFLRFARWAVTGRGTRLSIVPRRGKTRIASIGPRTPLPQRLLGVPDRPSPIIVRVGDVTSAVPPPTLLTSFRDAYTVVVVVVARCQYLSNCCSPVNIPN